MASKALTPDLDNLPVIIDNGSGTIKAGFAGDDAPKSVFPSMVGVPKHHLVMTSNKEQGTFIGKNAEEHRGLLKLHYPMSHGVVEDWSEMENIWNYVYENELKVKPEEHPVLLTEAPLNPFSNRERAAEIFFETFNVPALYIAMQAVLSLYASGKTTGVVIDSGDGVTHCVPIYEGFTMPFCITRLDLAGRDVTEQLQLLLRRSGNNLTTTAEKEVVRIMKEQLCYINTSAKQERELTYAAAAENMLVEYALPDGKKIKVGQERFQAPEILFQPSLAGRECMGVHEALTTTIQRADLDIRKTLYSNITLSGGSTLFMGYGDRLLSEVRKLAPEDIKIRISAPPERRFLTWNGGSILASVGTFKRMWITAEQYHDSGPSILHRNPF